MAGAGCGASLGGLPLFSDDSYQGPPAEDFENSRAEGVRSFKRGVDLGGQAGAAVPGAAPGGLWSAWKDASAGGEKPPLDFGFLLQGAAEKEEKPMEDVAGSPRPGDKPLLSSEEDSPAPRSHQARGAKKRGRTSDVGLTPVEVQRDGLCAPRPPRRPEPVLFGHVEGEDRGPNPMDPPIVRTDVFAWMRGPDNKADEEVMDLLREENTYTEAMQRHLAGLRNALYKEMLGHQREADTSLVQLFPGGYGYLVRTFEGKPYQAHYRRRALRSDVPVATAEEAGLWGEEELVLDENLLAVDPSNGSSRPYLSVSGPWQCPSHALYVYGTDFAGNDSYTLQAFSLRGGVREESQISIEHTDGSVHWAPSGDRFYYVELDDEFRQFRVRLHVIGQDPQGENDVTLLEEPDKKFNLSLDESGCKRYLVFTSASSETSEVRLLDLQSPESGLHRVSHRVFEHQYRVDHAGGWLYIVTNKDKTKNSKLCRVPLSALPDVPLTAWEDVWVPREDTKLDSHRCFQGFLLLEGRQHGEPRIFVHGYGAQGEGALHALAFPDAAAHCGRVLTPRGATAARAAFSAHLEENPIFETEVIRYYYESFTLPGMTYTYNVRTKEHRLVRQQPVPNFDPSLYRAERIKTPRRAVPISLVYRKDIHPQGLAGGPFPVLLTGYGAYGACSDPDFDGNRLSLLDRGVVYALAHVRGGGELGRSWYEEGRYFAVKNRFLDFVEAAETLVELHITVPRLLATWGTSSGGLLVAASANLRPDLFRAMLLEVPFVDALNTMRDPSIPLTTGEWEEVGNPNEREYFYYQLEYSPYDNIRMEAYPAALATSSLNDAMVGYWEPLKYISKLRLLSTAEDRPILLQADFHAGHGAASDRYKCLHDSAFHFAFLLDQLGLAGAQLLGTPGNVASARQGREG